MKLLLPNTQKGFTLVELLVVIAVLGVLAAGVLVAINPLEQLARGRDVSKKTAITELGRGLNTYLTTQHELPDGNDASGGFASALAASGEIRVVPTNPSSQQCDDIASNTATAGVENGYCFEKDANNEYVVYAPVESASEALNANNGTDCAAGTTAYVVYSSAAGRTGLVCSADVNPGLTALN